MLTLKQVQDICLFSSGSGQCRFLAEEDNKFYCLKLISQQRLEINQEVNDFINKHNSRSIDPYSMGLPLGDNCGGYRLLKAKNQGYDIDGKIP